MRDYAPDFLNLGNESFYITLPLHDDVRLAARPSEGYGQDEDNRR
jgi:hypothetical protein